MKQSRLSSPIPSRRQAGQTTLWVVIAVAALVIIGIILWSNRRTNTIRQQSTEQVTTLQGQIRGAEARARLSALKANILSGQAAEGLDSQYQEVRAGLEEGYANAEGAAAETWTAVQGDLDILGDQIREGSGDAVATIDLIIDRISQ